MRGPIGHKLNRRDAGSVFMPARTTDYAHRLNMPGHAGNPEQKCTKFAHLKCTKQWQTLATNVEKFSRAATSLPFFFTSTVSVPADIRRRSSKVSERLSLCSRIDSIEPLYCMYENCMKISMTS